MTTNFAIFIFDKSQSKGGCNDLHGFSETLNDAVKTATNVIHNDKNKVAQILNYSTGKITDVCFDTPDPELLPMFIRVVRVRTIEYKNKDYHQNVFDESILYNIGTSYELSLCAKCEDIKDRILFTNHHFICNECFFN